MNSERAEALGRRYLATRGHEEPEWAVIVLGGVRDERGCLWRRSPDGLWPDFRDPASRGVLLAEVREQWDDPTIFADCETYGADWHCLGASTPIGTPHGKGDTEAEALMAALEAAP